MQGVPLMVLANKQDLPMALAPHELTYKLELPHLTADRQWRIQGISGTTGEGLHESFTEFSKMVEEHIKTRTLHHSK